MTTNPSDGGLPVHEPEESAGAHGDTRRSQLLMIAASDAHFLDRGAAAAELVGLTGKPSSVIAQQAGISQAHFSKLITIHTLLHEFDKKCARAGTLSLSQAYRIVRGQPSAARTSSAKERGKRARLTGCRFDLGRGVALMVAAGTTSPLAAVIQATGDLLHRLNDAQARGIDTVAGLTLPAA
ncbi:MAG TPA: hypothetical protein VHN77_14635 [Phycisphaerales bacterium]|nr:hypothetical protein [Phycisphaerales bacterium]